MQKLMVEDIDRHVTKAEAPQTRIKLALGNKEHHESDLPAAEKDLTDLDVMLDVQPLEIIYQAQTLGEISRFFKVKILKDDAKLAARA